MTRQLRAVTADETAPPKSITEAAAAGSHRDLLVAMRARIAKTVEDPHCPPRDLASLTRRLQDIAKEIETLDLKAKQEADDDGARPDEAWNAEAL